MTTQAFETRSCWNTEYWLRNCEGYQVFADDEPIGYVEEIEFGPDEEPEALVIRVGEFFTHLLTVGVDAVETFDPAGERVFIGALADLESEAFVRQLRLPVVR